MTFVRGALDIYQTASIRDLDGPEIIDMYGDFTSQQFAAAAELEGGVQLLFIPARNEAADLPATLLAAAHTGEAFPVVLDNQSTDGTATIARSMGAMVVDVPVGNKMAATQAAYGVASELGAQNLYFTDADTLVVPSWVSGMRGKLEATDKGQGAAVFGNSILWHGESTPADIVCTAAKFARAAKQRMTGGQVVARGHNYAVRVDADGNVATAISELNPGIFTWDDTAIRDTLQKAGVPIVAASSLDTMVVTRNDHVASLRSRFSNRYGQDRVAAYDSQYGESVTYRA